jgi:hypothetical protein
LSDSVFLRRIRSAKNPEYFLSLLYFSSVAALIALIFVFHGAILIEVLNFFGALTLAQVPGTGVFLPAPSNPSAYVGLYNAAFQFCLGIGILEAVVLLLRPLLGSPLQRKAETIENTVFWFGASYLVFTYLNAGATINSWFVFWAGVVVVFALALIARGFVLLVTRRSG